MMSSNHLEGKNSLITHADAFMGPVLCEVFKERGAAVRRDTHTLLNPDEPSRIISTAGRIDALVVNLSVVAPTIPAMEVSVDEWRNTFAILVDPLPRLFRAVLP